MTPDQKTLIEKHTYLVPAMVKTCNIPQPWGREDLVSAGYEALCTAAERWDESQGVRFSTFANHRIRGAFTDEMRRLGWGSRSKPDWYYYLSTGDTETCTSLFYDDAYQGLEETSSELITRLMAKLPAAHRKVIEMFLGGIMFIDISRDMGVSPSRISQLYSEAIKRMRLAAA